MVSDVRKILRGIEGIDVVKSLEFKKLTTIGTGGKARALVFPKSLRDLKEVMKRLSSEQVSYFVFGRGSNILVPDEGVDKVGVGVCRHLTNVKFNGKGVTVEGGTSLPRLAVLCALSNLSGLEEFSGIPGAVGGALVMNAGAYGKEIGDLIRWVEIVDEYGEVHLVHYSQIDFSYRKAHFPVNGIIYRAYMKLSKGDRDKAFSNMRELNRKRREAQPWGEKTCGSVFKNPPGKSAGEIIERVGLKGFSVGNAVVSEKHANFIINRGSAKTADVLYLMERVRSTVFENMGINLEPEVKCIG